MKLTDLFEEVQNLKIVATHRFLQAYPKFARDYPGFGQTLLDFLEFRKNARFDQSFNTKDGALAGPLAGYRRVHIIHGKAILIYQIAKNEIRLDTIIDHKGYEGTNKNAMSKFLHSLDDSDFSTFQPLMKKEVFSLTDSQKTALNSLFKMLASDDRDVLEQVIKNDLEDFLDWVRIALEISDTIGNDSLIKAMGGKNTIIKMAKISMDKFTH